MVLGVPNTIPAFRFVKCVEEAHGLLTWILEHERPTRYEQIFATGVYVLIADGNTGLPLRLLAVGEMMPEEAEESLKRAQIKATRLALLHADDPSHLLSSQRAFGESCGGAVLFEEANLILACDGFSGAWDEAAMLALGHHALLVPRQKLLALASLSDNQVFAGLADRCAITV